MPSVESYDFLIVGGGVIGLSIAWQLSEFGKVAVVDRGQVGREASWAGAGILPPSNPDHAVHPIEKLTAESFRLHAEWATQLREVSGIDTGYRNCGAVLIARTNGEAAALMGQCQEWQEHGVAVEKLPSTRLAERLPQLSRITGSIRFSAWLPDESQIRNPHHLQALKVACQRREVCVLEQQGDCRLVMERDRLAGIENVAGDRLVADRYCLAAGAWSETLARSVGIKISTIPVRGQMLLFQLPRPLWTPIVYEGTRYIVPRDDGHVVVGSTLEEAGFDKSTTEDGIRGLTEFANGLFAELDSTSLIRSWAGLRPASFDGFPYIGRAPHLDNLWIATGHFRSGLLLSTGTAVVVSQLMQDEAPLVDLAPFRVDRG